jgi:hypothetical protein
MNENDYVAAGYGALAGILILYTVHLRHRARVLAAALAPPRARSTARAASTPGAGGTVVPPDPDRERP